MVVLFITSFNKNGKYQKFSIGHINFDKCFDMLDFLANSGCQLVQVELSLRNGNRTPLPVEMIDGEPLGNVFRTLQHEWESVLSENK